MSILYLEILETMKRQKSGVKDGFGPRRRIRFAIVKIMTMKGRANRALASLPINITPTTLEIHLSPTQQEAELCCQSLVPHPLWGPATEIPLFVSCKVSYFRNVLNTALN